MGLGSGMDLGRLGDASPQDQKLYREKPKFYALFVKWIGQIDKSHALSAPTENFGPASAWGLSRQVSTENFYSQAGPTFLHLSFMRRIR